MLIENTAKFLKDSGKDSGKYLKLELDVLPVNIASPLHD